MKSGNSSWKLRAWYSLSRKMAKNGSSITVSTKRAQNVLKSLDSVNRREKTAKREMNLVLHDELKFSWQRKIA